MLMTIVDYTINNILKDSLIQRGVLVIKIKKKTTILKKKKKKKDN